MEYNGSIGTKQSRIKLTERLLNSYGDKLVFLQLSARNAFTPKCFPGTPCFSGAHNKKAALILGELVLKCIEDTTPFPWPIKSVDLREKQYLKLQSLSLKTTVS